MPTKLSKPLTRRIGELVVRLTDEGIEVRRHRQRRAALKVSWEWFERRVAEPPSRKEAFEQPLPRGWIPKPGDEVFVAPIRGTLCRCVSTGLVIGVREAIPEAIIRVRLEYGRGRSEEQLILNKVRPLRMEFSQE